MADESKLKLKIILATLETDTTTLADEIGEQRPVVSSIVNGSRKAIKVRRKLAAALCQKVTDLIVLNKTEKELI